LLFVYLQSSSIHERADGLRVFFAEGSNADQQVIILNESEEMYLWIGEFIFVQSNRPGKHIEGVYFSAKVKPDAGAGRLGSLAYP